MAPLTPTQCFALVLIGRPTPDPTAVPPEVYLELADLGLIAPAGGGRFALTPAGERACASLIARGAGGR
jgi:hypothetical protein